jgi:hypothetical protein
VVLQVQRSASRGQQPLALEPRREEGALALLLQAHDADLHDPLGEALLAIERAGPEVVELALDLPELARVVAVGLEVAAKRSASCR